MGVLGVILAVGFFVALLSPTSCVRMAVAFILRGEARAMAETGMLFFGERASVRAAANRQ